ncbi:MAG TPA: porin, partial [Castellaniella sp.]|nr:porin [Castellaniella sp.]
MLWDCNASLTNWAVYPTRHGARLDFLMQYLQLPFAELEEQQQRMLLACSDSHKSTEISYMKKTLLAAALLAGFATAGVAQAETSVTLYGILDTGYGYQNFKNNHDGANDFRSRSSGLRSGFVNGNRWGLKGAEDLGDGLRAIFQLENGFNIGTGSLDGGNMFNRQAFVGLSSDNWGALTLGRQYSAGVDTATGEEMNGLGDYDKVFGAMGLSTGTRVNNSFKYTTPTFSGFKAVLLYGTGSSSTAGGLDGKGDYTRVIRQDNRDTLGDRGARASIGLMYTNGPLGVGAAYDRQSVYGQNPA